MTLSSLYYCNDGWDPDTQLTLFIDSMSVKVSARFANSVYGNYTVVGFNDTEVKLYKLSYIDGRTKYGKLMGSNLGQL